MPNLSEGRDPAVIASLANETAAGGALLLDVSSDPDHNRSVVTLAGTPEAVTTGLERYLRAAARMSLAAHSGVHPRVGIADVVPLIPLSGIDMAGCVAAARALGERVHAAIGLPVYFYGAAARRPEAAQLADIRRGGVLPDLGSLGHPAGAVCIGARAPLVAYNVMLIGATPSAGAAVARAVRGRLGIQALSFELPAGIQLSMNLTRVDLAGPAQVLDAVRSAAATLGMKAGAEEVVGLCPAIAASPPAAGRILEARLAGAAAERAADRCAGSEDRERVANKVRESAVKLRVTGAGAGDLLASAELSEATRRVLAVAGCGGAVDLEALRYAARALLASVPDVPEFRRRRAALESWLAGGSSGPTAPTRTHLR